MKKILIALLFCIGSCALAHAQTSTQIDPATRVNWPRITGAGTPTALGIPCSSANYGQPFQDTAVTPNTYYTCGSDGWVIRGGSITSVFGRTGAVTPQASDYSSYYVLLGGNAATATALATTPALCPTGEVASGVDASGNAVGCVTSAGVPGISSNGTTVTVSAALSTNSQTLNNASGVQNNGLNIKTNCHGFGWSYGNDGSSAQGWAGCSSESIGMYSSANGIQHGIGITDTSDNLGDNFPIYIYADFFGDGGAASNEGDGGITLQPAQVGYYTGTLLGAGTGGSTGSLYQLSETGITFMVGEFTTSGNVSSITLNYLSGHPPAVGQQTTIVVQNVTGLPGNQYSVTSPLIFTLTATSTALSQTFTSASGAYPAFSAIQGQWLGSYVASGTPTANLQQTCAYYVGAPTAGATIFNTCAGTTDPQYLTPAISAVVDSGSYTGSQVLATTGFTCNGYCDARSGSNFAQGGILFDLSQPILTAETTGLATQVSGLAPYYTLVTGSVTPSTAWGTVIPSSCTGDPNGESPTPVSVTCNFTLGTSPASPGPFTVGTNARIARTNVQEEVPITAVGTVSAGVQSVTFSTANAWNTSSYGPAAVMFQGGPSSSAIVPTAYASSWPIANGVLGAYTSTEVAVSTAEGKLVFPHYCAPGSFPTAPTVGYPNSSIVRSGNVVTLSFGGSGYGNDFNCLAAGNSFTLSGATPSDLNGTFTIVSNSYDLDNPYITWAQTGSNESSAWGTATITTPYVSLTMYPAAYIVGNNGGVSGNAQLTPNTAPWTAGDTVVGAPAPTFSETGMWINLYQASPNDQNTYGLLISGGYNAATQSGTTYDIALLGGAGSAGIHFGGAMPNDMLIDDRPSGNGAVLYVSGTETLAGGAKQYSVFKDNNNGGSAGTYAGSISYNPNTGNFGFSSGITALSGSFNSLSVGSYAVCTVNGTNCPVVNVNNTSLSVSGGTQAAGSCSAISSFTYSGVSTTSPGNLILAGYTGSATSLVGWGANGGMSIHLWPAGANSVAGEICNSTSTSITYSPITFAIGVK